MLHIACNKDTGEAADGKRMLSDEEKILEEEKYDGYCSIAAGALETDDIELRKSCRGPAKIEDTFKAAEACLRAGPVFVRISRHIEAHFAACCMALVLVRLFEAKPGNRFSADPILHSPDKYSCTHMTTNIWKSLYHEDRIKECADAFGMVPDRKYRTQQEIQRLLRCQLSFRKFFRYTRRIPAE